MIDTMYQPDPDTRPIFTHSVFTVGRADKYPDIVLIHVTVGTSKVEYRLTPANAREIAAALLDRAADVEGSSE